MTFVFIYNILLIILYSFTSTFTLNLYLKNKQPIFLLLLFLMVIFICDNVIVYMTEFINSFATEYNQTFMTAPFLKTIIFICCNFAYLAIINTISGRPFKNYQFVWLFLIGLWMLAKFRLKSLVVLFTQSAIFNLPWMLCALSTTNRSFISPCEKISSFYWLAKHWFRCGDSFGRYLRYF